jgi:hypothetical protein
MVANFQCSDWMWNFNWHWTLQTYFWLLESGCAVHLVREFPPSGIVVTAIVPEQFKPGPNLFVISIVGDGSIEPFAQMHLVQNKMQARLLPDSYHVPLWPQPGIIGRDPARGDRFDSIAYFGDDANIAPELGGDEWVRFLSSRGIDWHVRNARSSRNADFSDVDAVIGVRSFRKSGYIRKPASKLINGWIAGVPSILGREIAFREQRRSAVDYIEVATLAQARDAVDWLAGSPKLRRSMSANGAVRAEEFTTERIVSQWRHLLFYVAQKAAERWFSGSAAGHKRFFLRRQIQRKVRNIGHRALRAVGQEQYAI